MKKTKSVRRKEERSDDDSADNDAVTNTVRRIFRLPMYRSSVPITSY